MSPNSENINVYPDYKPKPPPPVLSKMQTQEGALLCPREGKNLARPPACQGPLRFAPLSAPLRFAPLRSALDRRALAGYLVPGRGQSKAQQSSPLHTLWDSVWRLAPFPPPACQCSASLCPALPPLGFTHLKQTDALGANSKHTPSADPLTPSRGTPKVCKHAIC